MVKASWGSVRDRVTATEEENASLRRGLDWTWSELKEQAQANLGLTSTLQSRILALEIFSNSHLGRIERLEVKLKELWGAFQNNTEVLEEMRRLVILHAEDKKRHNQGPSK